MNSFNLNFLLFPTKKFITSCLERWKERHKNIEFISRFKYADKIFLVKKFHGCFLTHIKTARFVDSLRVLGKCKISVRLQIYPKKILRRTNNACKALEKGTQDTYMSRVSKARKARKAQRNVSNECA